MDVLIYSTLTNFIYFCSGYIVLSKKKLNFEECFYVFFIGSLILSFFSLFFNFFFKLSPSFNSIVYIIIFLIFIIKSKLVLKFNKRIILFLIISSISTFLLIIFSNVNRPDAGLYHLPYISILNENKIIFGISNIHSRFAHTSILQYLSALNYNQLFLENGISIPIASVVSFFYIYFFNDILRVIKKKDAITYANTFSLFIVIYISYKVTRYSSFGNDAIAHLSFFYLVSYFLKSNLKNVNLNKLSIISVFIFINKPMMGLVFLIPLFIFISNKHYKMKKFLLIFFSFPTFFLFLWFLKNIFLSGCIIYPVNATCIKSLDWTNSSQIKHDKIQGSAWSKAWPDRINKDITISEYNKNFNWVKSWSNNHLKYILKIVLPFVLLLLLITLYFHFNIKNISHVENKYSKIKINFLLIFSFFSLIIFFLIFPTYRFGYSYLITFISLIVINFNKNKITSEKNIVIFKLFFIICIIAIISKQIIKINKNYQQKRLWPNIYSLEKKIKSYDKIVVNDNFYYYHASDGDGLCMYSNSPCTSYKLLKNKIEANKKYTYIIISLKHD